MPRKCPGIQEKPTTAGEPAWKAHQVHESVPDPRGAGKACRSVLLLFDFAFFTEINVVAEVFLQNTIWY